MEKKLTEADKNLSDLQKQQADRHLTEEQKGRIFAAISPYPGQQVDISAVFGDGEGLAYANEFLTLFRAANWKVTGVSQGAYSGDMKGIMCAINTAWRQRGEAPIGAGMFMKALISLGLIEGGMSDNSVTGDTIKVVIGRKPASP